jgi:hypothetical protein
MRADRSLLPEAPLLPVHKKGLAGTFSPETLAALTSRF